MIIHSSQDLTKMHTFGLQSSADYFAEPTNLQECIELIEFADSRRLPIFVLGGGSNLTPSQHVQGLVIRPRFFGIELVEDSDDSVVIKSASSENWHNFVMHTVDKNLFGIENLALIPGTVGAAPIQNIGAYGVEAKDTLTEVEYLDFKTKKVQVLQNKDCRFAYRDSRFKTQGPNQLLILSVSFRLSKLAQFHVHYGELKEHFKDAPPQTSYDVAHAVIKIRQSKLPDPTVVPNAGSFFKNPVIEYSQFESIHKNYPSLPHYRTSDPNRVKIAAGWLIDQCGWKGKSLGPVGTFAKQALCLVRHAHAELTDLNRLVEHITNDVQEKFGISLEREPIQW